MTTKEKNTEKKSLRDIKREIALWKEDVPRRERLQPRRLDEETCGNIRSKGLTRADIRVLAAVYGISHVRAANFLLNEVDPWDIRAKVYSEGKKLTRAAAARAYYKDQAEYLALTFGHPRRF